MRLVQVATGRTTAQRREYWSAGRQSAARGLKPTAVSHMRRTEETCFSQAVAGDSYSSREAYTPVSLPAGRPQQFP